MVPASSQHVAHPVGGVAREGRHDVAVGVRRRPHLRVIEDRLGLARVLIDKAAAECFGEYHPNALMDQVMGIYDWGDGALRKFHEKVKDALDLNSIMAPGKAGNVRTQVPRSGALTRRASVGHPKSRRRGKLPCDSSAIAPRIPVEQGHDRSAAIGIQVRCPVTGQAPASHHGGL
jgi:hypothetical protein